MKLRSLTVLLVLALAIGALTGALLLPPLLPESAAKLEEPRAVPVSQQEFDDRHTVSALPRLSDEVTVALSGGGGLITASWCELGLVIASGDVLFSVDGVSRVSLVTTVPLWRDLWPGSEGPDVLALQQSLMDMGYQVTADGVYGDATDQAVRELQEASSVEVTGAVLLNRVQWFPADAGPVSSCDAHVGTSVSSGGALLKAGGRLVELTIPASSADLDGHAYAVISADNMVVLGYDRLVTDPTILESISASAAFGEWKRDPGRGVAVEIQLAEPIPAIGVPPSAVISTTAKSGCVVQESRETVNVEVLASELGTVYVAPEAPISAVLIPASEVTGTCK